MPLTFGGKSAATVATRSPLLPPVDRAALDLRVQRVAQESARHDRHREAAAHRGRQVAWHAHRIAVLTPIRDERGDWLDANPDHPAFPDRTRRYWIVAHAIRAHGRQMEIAVEKAHDLIKRKPAKQQETLSAAFLAARNGPAPRRMPV